MLRTCEILGLTLAEDLALAAHSSIGPWKQCAAVAAACWSDLDRSIFAAGYTGPQSKSRWEKSTAAGRKSLSAGFDTVFEVVTSTDQKLGLAALELGCSTDWIEFSSSDGRFADLEILYDGMALALPETNANLNNTGGCSRQRRDRQVRYLAFRKIAQAARPVDGTRPRGNIFRTSTIWWTP